jgi:hypothetical protein
MQNTHLESIFTDYIRSPQTKYAILINGSWGSGKTFFWKNRLEQIAKDDNFSTIYISLNGLSKIESLEQQLFIKLLPILGKQENPVIKNTTTFIFNTVNAASKFFFKSGVNELFKGVSIDAFDFSKYIICFDDLERSHVRVSEVLGFINNFVEHKGLKTIILADENHIVDSQNPYGTIKEKVIGRVINFKLDIEKTVPHLFEPFKKTNPGYYNFLQSNVDSIIKHVHDYKQDNLRILSFYFEILEKLEPFLKTTDKKYVGEVVLLTLLISIEFKNGKLKSTDNNDFKNLEKIEEYYFSIQVNKELNHQKKDTVEEHKSYAQVFYETFLLERNKSYYFYQSIYSYILTGYLEEEKFKKEILDRYPLILSDEINSFRKLLHYKFRELEDIEFSELVKKVLMYAKSGKYMIYDYAQIANFFFYFSKHGIIQISSDEVKKVINEGLEIAESRGQIDDRYLANLLHFGDNDNDVTAVKMKIKGIHETIKKKHYVEESSELIKVLLKGNELELSALFEEHKFSKLLFEYVNFDDLSNAVSGASNKQIFNFTEFLKHRYDVSNIGQFLFEDSRCLSELRKKIGTHLETGHEGLRKHLLTALLTALDDILDHLSRSRNG